MPTAFRVLSVRFSFLFKSLRSRSVLLLLLLGIPDMALAAFTDSPSVYYTGGTSKYIRITWDCNASECNVLEKQGTNWVTVRASSPPGDNGLGLFRPIGTHNFVLETCWANTSGYIFYCSRPNYKTVEIRALPSPTITAPATDDNGYYSVKINPVSEATQYKVWVNVDGGSWSGPTTYSSAPTLNESKKQTGVYKYKAQACIADDCSADSVVKTVAVATDPGRPTHVTVPSLNDGTVSVGWGWTSGVHEVYRQKGSGSWTKILSTANSSFNPTTDSVDLGTYRYRVKACNSAGGFVNCSDDRTSNTTTAAKPVRTTLNYLPSTNTTGSYTVSWGNVDNSDSFELEEREGNGSWRQLSAISGTSKDRSKSSGTYSYRVRACNALGCAELWSPVKTIDVAVSPSRPSSISVPTSPTDGSFSVSWSSVSGVSRYELERRIDSGSWTNVHGNSSRSYSESPQGQGSYRYRVRACRIVGSAYGCSSWRTSGTVTVAPPANPPTLALPATSGTGDYQFSWTHVDNTTRYVLQENAGDGWVRQNLPTDQTRSFSYTGKGNGTYTYRVRACNAIGCSGFSQTATIDIALQPGVPAVITVPEAAGSTFNISWGTGSGSVTTYKLERQSGGESELIYAQATPHNFTETGLAAGTYTYRVRACRSTRSFENCSGWRTSDAVTVVAQPDMPMEGFTALPGENGGVALDWSGVASQITADISYFILEYHIDRGEWVSPYTYKGTDTAFTLPYIAEGEHQFSLRACILVETADPFELCSVRNLQPPPVAKPSDPPTWDHALPASSTDGYYQLSWTHTGDTSWYVVQESFNGGEWTEVATPTEQYHAFENQRSGRYRYRLQACNGFGCSEDTSAEHIVDVALEPDVPTWQSSATYSDGNHEVVWNNLLDNVTHYVLQTSSDNGTSWTEVSNSAALSHAFSELPAGTYQYRVAAHNNVGEISNQSGWSEVYTVTVAIPQVPSNVRVIDLVQNNFSVVWDSVDNVREYEIQEIIGVVLNTWRVDANTLGVYLADKAENTYAYRIRACNAVGCSEASAPAGVSVAITPGRPGSLTAVAGFETGLTELFWDTAAGAPDVYEVQQRIGNSGYGASVNYTGLSGIWPEAISQAGIYQYRVRACRSVGSHVGCSGWRSSNVIEYSIPGVPVLHGPEFAPSGTYVVSWIFDGEATEFILEENGVEQHLFTSSITFNEENPRPDGTYTYRVKACNLLDCSDYSLPLTVTVGVVEDPEEGGDGGDNGEDDGGVDGEGGSGDDGFLVESYPPSGPAPGEQVGAIEGHFRVNEAGAATYSIPLTLPKGTAGVTPQLGLAYSSQGGNGPLGQGWALEGLSSITRCRQTLSQDGQARPITWSAEDRFCLDGQRLILDGYSAEGPTYKTELDSFVTVTAHGGTTGHPEYFTVSAKDGSTSTYGGTADSLVSAGTHTLSWMRSRFADSVGNRIDFHYTGDADSGHRIQRVDYAYTDTDSSSNPRASVEFLYEDRPDASSSYVMGYRFSQTKRLRQIMISNAANSSLEEYRRYELVYQYDSVIPIDSTSRLESIEECVVARCLRKTTFTWPNLTALGDDQQIMADTDGGTLVLGDVPKVYTFRHLDINADGKLDLAWIRYRNDNPDHQELKYALAGDDGRYHSSRLALNGIFDTDLTSSNNKLEMHVIDYNADGRQDIMVRQSDAEEGYVWRLFLSEATGESWDLREELYTEFPFANTKVQFGDINSDGMADAYYLHDNRLRVHYLEKQEGGLTSNHLHYRYRQNFESLPIEGFETHFDDDYWEIDRPVSMGDFNGDGRVDLVVTAEYFTIRNYTGAPEPGPAGHGTQYFVLTSGDGQLDVFAEVGPGGDPIMTAFLPATDLNSDGLTDVIFRKDEAWQMSLSTGDGLTQAEIIDSVPGGVDDLLVADINRDGYPDLIPASTAGLQVYAWLPAENRFSHVGTEFNGGVYGREGYHTAIIDIDGDGWNDVVNFRDANSEWVEQSHWSTILADNRGETSPNLITEIQNGLGNKIEIDYQVLTGSNHYSRVDVDRVTSTALEEVCVPYPRGPNSDHEVCYTPIKHTVSTSDFYRSLNDPFSTLPEGNDHVDQAASPVLELYAPMPVVTSVASSSPTADDINGMARVSYFYDQLKFQAAGRGSLGFRKLTTVDHQTATVTETTYRQDWPFIGSPLETVVKTADGHLLSHAVNRWGLKTFPAEDGTVRYQPYIRESVEEGYDLEDNGGAQGPSLKTVTTTNTYDDYGNPLMITTLTEGNSESISKTVENCYGGTVENCDEGDGWADWKRLGRLTATTVTTTRGLETDTRRSEFDYIQSGAKKGLLVREIVEPGTAHELITTYTYDNYGNKTHAVQQAADGTSRQSDTTVYDAGRYVRTVTNALDHMTEEVLSRNRFGAPTRVRNINGVESTITYDDMGAEYLREDDTGAWAWTGRQYCDSGITCPSVAKYRVEERVAGGGISYTYHDLLGREVRRSSVSFDGRLVNVDTEYDNLGRASRVSNPYFNGSSPTGWTKSEYDILGRVVSIELPDGTPGGTTEYDEYQTITTNAKFHTKTEIRDLAGNLTRVIDNLGGTVDYDYDLGGNLLSATTDAPDANPVTVRMCYDKLGRKIAMHDPDKGGFLGNAGASCETVAQSTNLAGWWYYRHNGLGDLVSQTDTKGQTQSMTYDALGRMITRTDRRGNGSVEGYTRWYYDGDDNGSSFLGDLGNLTQVVQSSNGISTSCSGNNLCTSHIYDDYGRLTDTITLRPGASESYTTGVRYDSIGRPYRHHDALHGLVMDESGTRQHYNEYGYKSEVTDLATGERLHKINAVDARGQVLQEERGNGAVTDYEYDPYFGHLIHQHASTTSWLPIQDIGYDWDVLGNLNWRHNRSVNQGNTSQKDLRENFCYDGLNRLINSQQGSLSGACGAGQDVEYDGLGNITFKAGVGVYEYGANAGPHAVTLAGNISYTYDNNGNMTGGDGRTLSYSTFDKPVEISKGNHTTRFSYGPGRGRYQRVDIKNGVATTTRYLGSVERIHKQGDGTVTWRRTVAGAIYTVTTDLNNIVQGETDKAFVYKDHLGSTDVVTDAVGTVIESQSFDAWGQRRNSENWDTLTTSQLLGFNSTRTERGYTGHEQMDETGLIHMNGRVYDAKLARFLQADPFIQAASNTQSYNRYSYVWNNPLNATDPSGFILKRLLDEYHRSAPGGRVLNHVAGSPRLSMVISIALNFIPGCQGWCGAAVQAGFRAGTAYASTGSLRTATISGAISFGSSAAFIRIGASGGDGFGAHVGKSLAHGIVGGTVAVAQGGNFGHGFVSAGLTKLLNVNAMFRAAKMGGTEYDFARVITAAVIGGTISERTGGKFANGAITAAMGQALNGNSDNELDEQHKIATDAVNTVSKDALREYGGLIYRNRDGSLGYTRAASDGDRQSIAIFDQLELVPEGAVVIGGWHTHYKGLHPVFSNDDLREANSYGTYSELQGVKIEFNGLYVGGASNSSIRYYPSGDFSFERPNSPVPRVYSGKYISENTIEIGRWE